MVSFESIPQEVVPNNASNAQIEREKWEQMMADLPEVLRGLSTEERKGAEVVYTLASLWTKQNHEKSV